MGERATRIAIYLSVATVAVTIIVALFGDNLVGRIFQGSEPGESNVSVSNDSVLLDDAVKPADGLANAMTPEEPPSQPRPSNETTNTVAPPARENLPEQPSAPVQPPQVNRSRNCPAHSIVLRFARPGNVSGAFRAIVDGTQVEMFDCEPSGSFVTHFNRDRGSIDGTGRWSSEEIRFTFGYRNSRAGEHPIQCSANGPRTANAIYVGTLTCFDDDDHDLNVDNVTIRL